MSWGFVVAIPLILIGVVVLLIVAILGVFILFPVKLVIDYRENDLLISLKVLFYTRILMESNKEEDSSGSPSDTPSTAKEKNKKNYFRMAKIGYKVLETVASGGPLYVDKLSVDMTLGGDNPADIGILFGRVHAVLGACWPLVERIIVIKRPSIQTRMDFTLETTQLNEVEFILPIPIIRTLYVVMTTLMWYHGQNREEETVSTQNQVDSEGV